MFLCRQQFGTARSSIVFGWVYAGHMIGANTIYASKADGLTIGTFNTGLIYNQLIKAEGVKFDLTKMSWVGNAASEPRVFVVGAQSPIKTFADLQALKEPANFAT